MIVISYEYFLCLQAVNHIRTPRRRTIGGIDFERITASQTGEYQEAIRHQKDKSRCAMIKSSLQ